MIRHNNKHTWSYGLKVLLLSCLVLPLFSVASLVSQPAYAQTTTDTPGQARLRNAYESTQSMLAYAGDAYSRLDNTNAAKQFSNALMTFFIMLMILKMLTQFVMMSGGPQWTEIFENALVIMIVLIISGTYDIWTKGIFDVFQELGAAIQGALICDRDQLGAFKRIDWALDSYTLRGDVLPDPGDSPLTKIKKFFKYMGEAITYEIAGLIFKLASFIAFLVSIWGLWGYAVAKMIGWFFVPFLLFKKLAWLFDGWFKLFIKYIVYILVVRVTLSLAVIGLLFYVNVLPGSGGLGCAAAGGYAASGLTEGANIIQVNEATSIVSVSIMPIMSIMVLLSTNSITGALAGGVQGLGAAINQLRGAARSVGKGLNLASGGSLGSAQRFGQKWAGIFGRAAGNTIKNSAGSMAGDVASGIGGVLGAVFRTAGDATGATPYAQKAADATRKAANYAANSRAGKAVGKKARDTKSWIEEQSAKNSKATQHDVNKMAGGSMRAEAESAEAIRAAGRAEQMASQALAEVGQLKEGGGAASGLAGGATATSAPTGAEASAATESPSVSTPSGSAATGVNSESWTAARSPIIEQDYAQAVDPHSSMTPDQRNMAVQAYNNERADQQFASEMGQAFNPDYDSARPPGEYEKYIGKNITTEARQAYDSAMSSGNDKEKKAAMEAIREELDGRGLLYK